MRYTDRSMKRDPLDIVASALAPLSLRGKTVLAACSGGADSTFLLVALSRLRSRFGFDLVACTVNHRIRPDSESALDADFVESLAATLEPAVTCVRKDLAAGEADRVNRERGKGLEEAARHLRYRAFAEARKATGADRVMTGHNRDDRAETVLMRFLSGSGGSALSGIARERGEYFRPLLDLSHAEMTEWLGANGYSWREDATNGDARYYRNRVRNRLVPVLDSFFPGWETGVLSAASRAALDEDLCHSLMGAQWERVEGSNDAGLEAGGSGASGGIRCESAAFLSLHPAVRLRFLRDGLALLSPRHRVPSGYLERIAALDSSLAAPGESARITGSGLSFERSGAFFFWKPDIVQNDKSGYLVYIRSCGAYSAPFGDISVLQAGISVYIDRCPGTFALPLTVRSRQAGDTVRTADGKQKTLKKLMNEWSVRESDRDLLPVIEENGKIRAVWGGALGYPDWFVQI